MAEITRTINGHKYKYLSYWDKETKERKQIYLGRLTENGELIPPTGNIPLKKITGTVDFMEKWAGLSRKEAWETVIEEAKKYHKHEIHSFRSSLKRDINALFKLLIWIVGIIAAFLFINMLFNSGIIH